MAEVLFFHREPDIEHDVPVIPKGENGYDVEVWRASLRSPLVPGAADPRLWAYSVMFGVVPPTHGAFGAIVLRGADGAVAHRSLVFPRFARFPFMAQNDLQIGATSTQAPARGIGLATHALTAAVAHFAGPHRAFWYLTEEDNHSSVAVALKCGFSLVGRGARQRRLGLMMLGYYEITDWLLPSARASAPKPV